MSTAAQLMVKCLENEGVSVVFGLPGEENIRFVQALAVLRHPLCAHPARAGGVVHGGDVRPGHRPGGGGVGHLGSGRDQHAARGRRRHHQQHPDGRDLRAGRPGSRVQRVAPVRRPGVDVRADHPVGRRYPDRAGHTGDVPQGVQARRDRTPGRGLPGRARAHRRRRHRLRPDTVAAQRRSRRRAGLPAGGARGRHPARGASDRWCWPGMARPAATQPRPWSGSPRNSASRWPTPFTARA